MAISDYQITNVIRTYMRNMNTKIRQQKASNNLKNRTEDIVSISEEGMKKFLERIEETVVDRVKKNEKVA